MNLWDILIPTCFLLSLLSPILIHRFSVTGALMAIASCVMCIFVSAIYACNVAASGAEVAIAWLLFYTSLTMMLFNAFYASLKMLVPHLKRRRDPLGEEV